MANSAINVMVDAETKEEATKILKDLGLSMSTAINVFLKQVVQNDGLPFKISNKKPSKKLLDALEEVDYIEKHPEEYKKYNNLEDLKKDLLSDDEI